MKRARQTPTNNKHHKTQHGNNNHINVQTQANHDNLQTQTIPKHNTKKRHKTQNTIPNKTHTHTQPQKPNKTKQSFTFDHVYDQDSTQDEVYDASARALVRSTLEGYNAAIIAYGQTGTGKTYTMEGDLEGPLRGIIPRSVEDIFSQITHDPEPSSR